MGVFTTSLASVFIVIGVIELTAFVVSWGANAYCKIQERQTQEKIRKENFAETEEQLTEESS